MACRCAVLCVKLRSNKRADEVKVRSDGAASITTQHHLASQHSQHHLASLHHLASQHCFSSLHYFSSQHPLASPHCFSAQHYLALLHGGGRDGKPGARSCSSWAERGRLPISPALLLLRIVPRIELVAKITRMRSSIRATHTSSTTGARTLNTNVTRRIGAVILVRVDPWV